MPIFSTIWRINCGSRFVPEYPNVLSEGNKVHSALVKHPMQLQLLKYCSESTTWIINKIQMKIPSTVSWSILKFLPWKNPTGFPKHSSIFRSWVLCIEKLIRQTNLIPTPFVDRLIVPEKSEVLNLNLNDILIVYSIPSWLSEWSVENLSTYRTSE